MDAVTQTPAPERAGAARTRRAAPSAPSSRPRSASWPSEPIDADRHHRRRAAAQRGGEPVDVVQPHNHRARAGHLHQRHPAGHPRRHRRRQGRRPGLARAVLRRPRRDPAARRRPADRPVARHAERGHHARPVQDRDPGRDRRRLRARRLLALQRRTSPAASWPSSRTARRACGTGWTTARWRASSTRSRRSTSRRSPANLPTAPALMGNTVLWKPSPTQTFSAHLTMRLLEAAGCRRASSTCCPATASPSPRSRWPHPTWPASTSPAPPRTFQHLWAHGRREHRRLPRLPAPGRRDRRQGLRARAPVRRPRRAAHRADPRRLRVPGPEVLRRVPRLRAALASGTQHARRPGRRDRGAERRRRHRPHQLHGRGHRPARVRPSLAGVLDRARADEQPGRPHRRHRRRQRRLLRPARPSCSAPTRSTRCSAPSTSARCSPCTSTRTPTSTRCCASSTPCRPYAPDRRDHRHRPRGRRAGRPKRCASPRATSTSTTSRPARSSASSPSAAARASGTNDKAGAMHNLLRWVQPAVDQGDLRPADRRPLPAPGLMIDDFDRCCVPLCSPPPVAGSGGSSSAPR